MWVMTAGLIFFILVGMLARLAPGMRQCPKGYTSVVVNGRYACQKEPSRESIQHR